MNGYFGQLAQQSGLTASTPRPAPVQPAPPAGLEVEVTQVRSSAPGPAPGGEDALPDSLLSEEHRPAPAGPPPAAAPSEPFTVEAAQDERAARSTFPQASDGGQASDVQFHAEGTPRPSEKADRPPEGPGPQNKEAPPDEAPSTDPPQAHPVAESLHALPSEEASLRTSLPEPPYGPSEELERGPRTARGEEREETLPPEHQEDRPATLQSVRAWVAATSPSEEEAPSEVVPSLSPPISEAPRPSAQAPLAARPDAAREEDNLHVSIGAIHVAVEAPDPSTARSPGPPAPAPAAAPRLRRHYLRP